MIKNIMASRLLSNELKLVKSVMEEVNMAVAGRHSGIGFVYGNLGDLIKKVQHVGASTRPTLFQHAIDKKERVRGHNDSLEQLKHNVSRIQEMQGRLEFMLNELEGLVKKSS